MPRHRTIHGEILAVRNDGTPNITPGAVERAPADAITYDIILFGGGELNSMENQKPYRRPYGSLRIISAAVGDPCTVIVSTDYTDTVLWLSVSEDLDFHDCDGNPLIP